jgi:hypothetical protein
VTLRALAVAAAATTGGLGLAAATATAPEHDAVPQGQATAARRASPGATIRSRDARIRAGDGTTLLSIPRVGRFSVACGAGRRSRVTFRAAWRLPTSDVVVSDAGDAAAATLQPSRTFSRPAARVLAQTWQIAPFASAGVRVVTVHITARPVGSGCAAAAMAITGPDQGHSRTAAVPSRAVLAGEAVALDDPEWSGPAGRDGRRRRFAGFLQPTGLTRDQGRLRLVLWIDSARRTALPVWRHAGWG